MKPRLISYSSALAMTLFAMPISAWADHNPDFDDDAKPLLRMQPGLLEYVESRFQVKDTGIAKVPGDDERHAMPPYIFQAKPRGYPGSYYITFLIQPGKPGHILKIVDPTRQNGGTPSKNVDANNPPEPTSDYQPAPPHQPGVVAQTPAVKAPAQSSKTQAPPTADTPSGPVAAPFPSPPSSTAPSLEPPPDPPPATH